MMLKKSIYLTVLIALLFQACGNDTSKKDEASDQGERLRQFEFGNGPFSYGDTDHPYVEIIRSRERLIEYMPSLEHNNTHPLYPSIDFTKDIVLIAKSPKEMVPITLHVSNATAYSNYVEIELTFTRTLKQGDLSYEPTSTGSNNIIYDVGNRPIRFTRSLAYYHYNNFEAITQPDLWFDPLVWKDELKYSDQSYDNLLANNGWVYNPHKNSLQTLHYETLATQSTINDKRLHIYHDIKNANKYFNLNPLPNLEGKSLFAVVDNMSFEDISYDHTSISLNYPSASAGCKDLLCQDIFAYGTPNTLTLIVQRFGFKDDCDNFDTSKNDGYGRMITYADEQNRIAQPVYIQTICSCSEYTDIVDANMTAWLFENFWDRIYDHGYYW